MSILTLVRGATATGHHHATAATPAELDAAFDQATDHAVRQGYAQQVDVWSGPWTIDDPGLPDPLVQITVGHPDRASVTWHEGDDSLLAVDPTSHAGRKRSATTAGVSGTSCLPSTSG